MNLDKNFANVIASGIYVKRSRVVSFNGGAKCKIYVQIVDDNDNIFNLPFVVYNELMVLFTDYIKIGQEVLITGKFVCNENDKFIIECTGVSVKVSEEDAGNFSNVEGLNKSINSMIIDSNNRKFVIHLN